MKLNQKKESPMKAMLSLVILLSALMLVNEILSAQVPDFKWAKRAGGNRWDYGRSVARDGANNIIITGSFEGTATFGSTTLTAYGSGSSDIFIAKYDNSGNAIWATQAGGIYKDDDGRCVTTDNLGDVIVTGGFYKSATFGSITLTSAGLQDIFIAKYDASSGNVLWVNRMGGTQWDMAFGIKTDDSRNIFVTGQFSGSVTFGSTTLTSAGSNDIFIAKYDASGNLLWAKRAGGLDTDAGYGIATDKAGNCIVTGHFYYSAAFESTILTSSGMSDLFIAKYSPLGNLIWAKRAGGTKDEFAYSVETNKNNWIAITGKFCGSSNFDGTTLVSAGNQDIFVAVYDDSGFLRCAQQAGGASFDRGCSVTIDKFNNIIVAGYFYDTALFGTTILKSAGDYDIFVAKYDAFGDLLWAKRAGGSQSEFCYGITSDLSANIILTGYFYGSAVFDATTLTSFGGSDIFLAKLIETPSQIHVTYPNGGEQLLVASPYEITWTADLYTGTVEISLSKDNGTTWTNLTPFYPENTGHYAFIPRPEHVSDHCLIRVTSIENALATDQSDHIFSISGAKKHYLASHIPAGVSEPIIDGNLNDNAWSYASGTELLAIGGIPEDFSKPWTNFADNKVSWKAVWSSATNQLYIAIEIKDDVAGAIDNDYDFIWQDDCIELYTDGDNSGSDYQNTYDIAQQWQIRKDNAKHLGYLAGAYTGPAISSMVSPGTNGNWIVEVAMTIYDLYPSVVKALKSSDVIGWDLWYDDSDNEHQDGGKWVRDHQVGWAYTGPAYRNADFFHELELGPIDQQQQHFTRVWTGNPYQPMTIYCTRAQLNKISLEAGDEIGVFDGPKCVGAVILSGQPSFSNPVEIICSKDDGTGNGFIEGNSITFSMWDQSAMIEYAAGAQFIDLQTGAPVSPTPFIGLGTAAVELAAPGVVSQSIPLQAGWNIFSLAVTPEGNHDMLKVLSPVLNNLTKVIDEQGHSIVKLFGNWTNSIGNWQPTEGYYINMSHDDTLDVTGKVIMTPVAIPLNAGWNIISYPCLSGSQNALAVMLPLINSGNLVKAIDEQGHSVVKIFGNWTNSIGDLQSGDGYCVNVNANCSLTITSSGVAMSANHPEQLDVIEASHFKPESSGHPFEPMNIFVVEACVDGEHLNTADEIAIYDGDRCLGFAVLSHPLSSDQPLEIIASKDDGSGNGFKDGGQLSFKIWQQNIGEELVVLAGNVQYLDPEKAQLRAASSFEALGTAVVALNLTTTSVTEAVELPQRYCLHQNYPNPFNPTTMISYELPVATNVTIAVYDLNGKVVRSFHEGPQAAGHHTVIWDGKNHGGTKAVSGVYFYRITTNQFTATKKMILMK